MSAFRFGSFFSELYRRKKLRSAVKWDVPVSESPFPCAPRKPVAFYFVSPNVPSSVISRTMIPFSSAITESPSVGVSVTWKGSLSV